MTTPAPPTALSESTGLTLHFNWRPVRSLLRVVAILFGGPFRSAEAGWIEHGSDVLEWCRYARCCHTLWRDHAARMDGLRHSRRLPGQP
jgi:hypothetical protein